MRPFRPSSLEVTFSAHLHSQRNCRTRGGAAETVRPVTSQASDTQTPCDGVLPSACPTALTLVSKWIWLIQFGQLDIVAVQVR